MIQINFGDHRSRVPGYESFPQKWHVNIRWARQRAIWIAANIKTANPYFRSLPRGRSLTQLLDDSSIWINYGTFPFYGETEYVGGTEMAISEYCYPWGKWTILGTLIHELAHVNGALGEDSHAAERAVLECGLGTRSERRGGADNPRTPYDPRIIGMIAGPGSAHV